MPRDSFISHSTSNVNYNNTPLRQAILVPLHQHPTLQLSIRTYPTTYYYIFRPETIGPVPRARSYRVHPCGYVHGRMALVHPSNMYIMRMCTKYSVVCLLIFPSRTDWLFLNSARVWSVPHYRQVCFVLCPLFLPPDIKGLPEPSSHRCFVEVVVCASTGIIQSLSLCILVLAVYAQ